LLFPFVSLPNKSTILRSLPCVRFIGILYVEVVEPFASSFINPIRPGPHMTVIIYPPSIVRSIEPVSEKSTKK